MKTKLLLFLLLLGLLVTGCQNDILQDEPAVKGKVLPEVDAEDLALAILWYEEHRIEQFSTRTGGNIPFLKLLYLNGKHALPEKMQPVKPWKLT